MNSPTARQAWSLDVRQGYSRGPAICCQVIFTILSFASLLTLGLGLAMTEAAVVTALFLAFLQAVVGVVPLVTVQIFHVPGTSTGASTFATSLLTCTRSLMRFSHIFQLQPFPVSAVVCCHLDGSQRTEKHIIQHMQNQVLRSSAVWMADSFALDPHRWLASMS